MVKCRSSLLLVLTLVAGLAMGSESPAEFDGYEVHYAALPSTFLDKKTARQYDLVRSRAVGLLNVSVHRTNGDNGPEPITAQVEGTVTNEARQVKELSFQRVQEDGAIYYLGQFRYSEGKTMTFELEAAPYGKSQTLPVRFSRELYHDQ
ncbi:DUF4426 domain-containing protein [Salicola sp. Rm-C-2C1-2]|uniref:DUF4426 domain-containing protein n=1 Tax=Salicola sp. Rm-C-2C1-2 TaxID=3141321 RepID=UPI0032E4F2A8